jgi:hypothetical protein
MRRILAVLATSFAYLAAPRGRSRRSTLIIMVAILKGARGVPHVTLGRMNPAGLP